VASLQATAPRSEGLSWFAGIESWRIGFFVSGLMGVVWCVAFYPWFRDDPASKNSVNPAELRHIRQDHDEDAASHSAGADIWRKLFAAPSLWAMALYYVCGSFGWSFFVSWMPRYMKDTHGVTFEKSEWSSAWPLLCGGVACLVGGVLSDALVKRTGWRRMGRAVFPVGGCVIAAVAMSAIPHVRSQREATILMCVAAAAFDFGQAANWAAIVDMGGRYAGIALGFINMVGNMGNAAQPYIGAEVFNAFGWGTLFGLYALAFLMAAAMWAIINPLRVFYEASLTGGTP
jgi:sugar phosphate permease